MLRRFLRRTGVDEQKRRSFSVRASLFRSAGVSVAHMIQVLATTMVQTLIVPLAELKHCNEAFSKAISNAIGEIYAIGNESDDKLLQRIRGGLKWDKARTRIYNAFLDDLQRKCLPSAAIRASGALEPRCVRHNESCAAPRRHNAVRGGRDCP